jgi:hypothetical protein
VFPLQAETATIDQLGTARKITIRATETTIIADAANKEEISIRVAQVGRPQAPLQLGRLLLRRLRS